MNTEQMMKERAWHLSGFLIAMAVITYMLTHFKTSAGNIGHDYYHQFVRLFIGALHFWQNGWSVPNYTPALCGGIGIFADPQSAYYSIPQFLTFFFEPWTSTIITLTVFYLFGYWGFYLLARRLLNLPIWLAHLSGLLFITNGFSFSHLYVGHLTHHTFLLFPWYLYLLLVPYPKQPAPMLRLFSALSFTVLLSYLLYSGSVHMIIVFLFATLLCVPTLISRLISTRQERVRALDLIAGVALCGLIGLSKIYAIHNYSTGFYIRGIDFAPGSVVGNVLRYFWFLPQMTEPAWVWANILMGAWEYLGFVSKLTIPALIIAGLLSVKKSLNRPSILVIVSTSMIAFTIVGLAFNALDNSSWPFMKSYHNPIKILGAFVPFFCLFAGYGLMLATQTIINADGRFKPAFFIVLVVIICSEFVVYSGFFFDRGLGAEFGYHPALYNETKKLGRLPPIMKITDTENDWNAIAVNSSRLHCYEPSFGYRHEAFKHRLVVGSTDQVTDGFYNLTHPGCLVYPNYFKCERFSRISHSEGGEFKKFAEGFDAFGVPPLQTGLNWLAAILAFGTIIVWFILVVKLHFRT